MSQLSNLCQLRLVMQWTQEQENLFSWVIDPNSKGHASISAVAGSGKTTTLIQSVKRITANFVPVARDVLQVHPHPQYPNWIGILPLQDYDESLAKSLKVGHTNFHALFSHCGSIIISVLILSVRIFTPN
jgi:hypothetical protein